MGATFWCKSTYMISTRWDVLPVEEQERAIGRTKLNDIEMPDDVKPANSHVALNTIIDENGAQRQIMRFNMPFGRVGAREFGTYYIAYANHPDVIEEMLTNMFIGKPPGNTDRILDFSTALTGTLFYVPSADFLDDPPGLGSLSTGATVGGQSSGEQSSEPGTSGASGSVGGRSGFERGCGSRCVPRYRQLERRGEMSHLLRSHAPITEMGWKLLDDEARQRSTPALAARKLVDFSGPHGWDYSATNLGRTKQLAAGPSRGGLRPSAPGPAPGRVTSGLRALASRASRR